MTRPRSWRLVRAPSQAIPASVRRFNQRARRHRLRAAGPWLAGVLALGLIGLVLLVLYRTSLFGVDRIEVRGNQITTADAVRAAARIPDGTPMASVDLGAVRRRVGTLPAVRDARVTRDWPGTVVITVTERTPVAAVPRPDQRYDLVDAAGVVFRTVETQPSGLPRLQVAHPGPADVTTRAALQVLAALTAVLRGQLVTLAADSPTRIRLELRAGRQIIWGDATQNAAKAQVATTLLARDEGRVIDVSAPGMVTVN